MSPVRPAKRIPMWARFAIGLLLVLGLVGYVGRDNLFQHWLDPRVPFQTYQPPPQPDYRQSSSWVLWSSKNRGTDLKADVFFVHPTTFDGGKHWNGPIDDVRANRILERDMLPNYAGPFVRVGTIYAPRYRQASLYTQLTNRDDAREARRFAYNDIKAAFLRWKQQSDPDRPLILVGVEQGGVLVSRLLQEEIAGDPELKKRLVAAYLIGSIVAKDEYGPQSPVPACQDPGQTHCVLAWSEVRSEDAGRALELMQRSLIWSRQGRLADLGNRAILCVNPVTGKESSQDLTPSSGKGAVNATGLEWGVRPALLQGQVSSRCVDGILRVSGTTSPSLRRQWGWAANLRAPAYNLFFSDIESDALTRLKAWRSLPGS
jgi:hypothetical protein